MLVTISFELALLDWGVSILHLQEQLRTSRARNMERLVATLIGALDASTHFLLTDVAGLMTGQLRILSTEIAGNSPISILISAPSLHP